MIAKMKKQTRLKAIVKKNQQASRKTTPKTNKKEKEKNETESIY